MTPPPSPRRASFRTRIGSNEADFHGNSVTVALVAVAERRTGRHIVSLDVAADDPIVNDLAAADFDGYSRLDVLVAMNRGLNVMWGHDLWGTPLHRPITEMGEHRFVATGDGDGDGQIDVVASMYNTNSNFRAYFGSILETRQ